MIDGVDGSKVPSKALPYTMNQSSKVIGCWRAHMNVLHDMVARKVQSKLIFEDDADWDVSLKTQLVQFAHGSRYISGTPQDIPTKSPYGDGWDLLWLGHCGTWVDPWDGRRFVIPNDPTVEPVEKRDNIGQPDMSPWEGQNGDNSTRIVFSAYGGVCTAAYAISLKGAEKALYHMSMTAYNAPVDW